MNVHEENVIGIVGGMGPQAGATLFNNITRYTMATADQQHLSVILMSFPRHIGDRTAFIEGNLSVNPALSIVKIINKLEKAGANVVGIACNTSHVPEIYDIIQERLKATNSRVKLLSMPLETCRYVKRQHPHFHRIGLMTTNGTYRSGLYRGLLEAHGYQAVVPDFHFQDSVIHKMIYDSRVGLKANPNGVRSEVRLLMEKALSFFQEQGAEAIILGCTELSLVLAGKKRLDRITIIDSSEALAKALVHEAINATSTMHKEKAAPVLSPVS